MRRLPLPLLVLIILLAAPVAIPTAIVSWMRDHRRMRAVAEQTPCECKLWAICAACGVEYDYDFGSRIFHRATSDYWNHR